MAKERTWDNCPCCGTKLLREYWGMKDENIICWRYTCDNGQCKFGINLVDRPINDTEPIN